VMKFLVIEDSQEIVDAVSLCLSLRWPEAEVLSSSEGTKGLEMVEERAPDLVILDIGLPDINGLDVLRAIRGFSDVPVVMLTARSQDVEIARYLEEGADEYVVKPFSHVEFMGRIQAIFRRAHGRMRSASRPLQAGDLLMDFGGAEVYEAGELVSLTRTELALLEHLVRNATRVVTYESLASNMMQVAEPADADSRLIKVHVQHLRSKLGDSAENPKYIANVYGIGYKFLPQVTSGVAGIKQQSLT
jgi:DNA-binding response OmpR family regulator